MPIFGSFHVMIGVDCNHDFVNSSSNWSIHSGVISHIIIDILSCWLMTAMRTETALLKDVVFSLFSITFLNNFPLQFNI